MGEIYHDFHPVEESVKTWAKYLMRKIEMEFYGTASQKQVSQELQTRLDHVKLATPTFSAPPPQLLIPLTPKQEQFAVSVGRGWLLHRVMKKQVRPFQLDVKVQCPNGQLTCDTTIVLVAREAFGIPLLHMGAKMLYTAKELETINNYGSAVLHVALENNLKLTEGTGPTVSEVNFPHFQVSQIFNIDNTRPPHLLHRGKIIRAIEPAPLDGTVLEDALNNEWSSLMTHGGFLSRRMKQTLDSIDAFFAEEQVDSV